MSKKKKNKEKDNIQKLLDAGVSQAFIDAIKKQGKVDGKKTTSNLIKGTNVDPQDVQAVIDAWNSTPDYLKTDPNFLTLPAEAFNLAIYTATINASNDADKLKKLNEALDMAQAQAEPYWAEQLRIAQDSVLQSYSNITGDMTYQKTNIENKIKQINEDLTSNKDFLTLNEQQDMANMLQSYQVQLDNVNIKAADTGMTFSTQGTIERTRISNYNQGLMESSQRQYEKQVSDLEKEAARGNEQAAIDLVNLQRTYQGGVTSIGRTAETTLGTSNLPALEGYTPLRDVTGELYENRILDTEKRKESIYEELTASSLTY